MMRFFFILAFYAISLSGCADTSRGGTPQLCESVEKESACRVSFRALAADPASFNGRKVRVEGYLGVSGRLFVLSSSKELFDAGVSDEVFVRIRGPINSQRQMFYQHAYSWVSVTGTFRTKEKNGTTDDILIGELHSPTEVKALRLPIPERRETFDEAVIDLRDLK